MIKLNKKPYYNKYKNSKIIYCRKILLKSTLRDRFQMVAKVVSRIFKIIIFNLLSFIYKCLDRMRMKFKRKRL